MFKVDSFIKNPGVEIERSELKVNPYKYFIKVSDYEKLLQIEASLDWDYLDGAIRLSYRNSEILDFEYWDLVDQCWLYLCDMIDEVNDNLKSERYFPDMPIQIKMTKVSSGIISFQLESKEWLLPNVEFRNAIYQGAIDFYTNLIHCFGTKHPQFQWWDTELKKLKQQI